MKRISSTMNFIFKKAVYGCVVLGCAVAMVACDSTSAGKLANIEDIVASTVVARYTQDELPKANKEMLKLSKEPQKVLSTQIEFDMLSGDKTLKPLSKDEIEEMLRTTNPKTTWPETKFYEFSPKITPAYNTGKLTQNALQAGLDRINVIRRLMGVHPVELGATYTSSSQIGSLLHAITQTSGHKINGKPVGMEDSVFNEGNAVLSVGNTANNNLPVSADEWLDDRGVFPPLHRVWMTCPKAGKFGMGYVEKNASDRSAEAPVQTGYSFLRACDQSAKVTELYPEGWDFVAWPAPGYTPLGLWPETHVANASLSTNIIYTSAWSIMVPYDLTFFDLTLTRTRNGETKKWGLLEKTDPENPLKKFLTPKISDGFDSSIKGDFNIGGPGSTAVNTYSFYITDTNHRYEENDIYTVEIKYGGVGGAGRTISYKVTFFNPAL